MPYCTEWIDPELFLEYRSVKIYHAYKDNESDQRLSYHYTTSNDNDGGINEFDVRDLPGWHEDVNNHLHMAKAIIMVAIDLGMLTQHGYIGN